MNARTITLAAAAALAGTVLLTPAASAAPEPPDSCPNNNMCVYSQGGFGGNEISAPPQIPFDIPANFGGVHSWYNNSDVRWCAHFASGGVYQLDTRQGLGQVYYDVISVAADGSC